jgi:uncharacterized membrane protein
VGEGNDSVCGIQPYADQVDLRRIGHIFTVNEIGCVVSQPNAGGGTGCWRDRRRGGYAGRCSRSMCAGAGTCPAALIEDATAIVLSILIVMRS